jgi:outer membrane autotransporter protein
MVLIKILLCGSVADAQAALGFDAPVEATGISDLPVSSSNNLEIAAAGLTEASQGAIGSATYAGTYRIGTPYTLLTVAGGQIGSLVSASDSLTLAGYINPVVSYDANDAYLTLDPTPAEISGGQEVPDMLTALASTAAGVGDTVLGDVCGAAARRQAGQGQGCVLHVFAAGYRSELWLRGIGGLGSLSGGGALMDFRDGYGGMLLGGGIGRGGFTVGLGAGYVATTLSFCNGSSASQNAGVGFVYARYVQGPAWLGLTAAYGGGQVEGTRALPGTELTASGNRAGDFAIVQGRAAYDLAVGTMTVQPTATVAYLHAGQSDFSETGSSPLDLGYGATSADEVAARLAARAMRSFAARSWVLTPWAEAGVQETLSGLSRAVVVTAGDFSSRVAGVAPAPTGGIVGVGLDAAGSDSLHLFIRYQGLFSANQLENAFSAGLSVSF